MCTTEALLSAQLSAEGFVFSSLSCLRQHMLARDLPQTTLRSIALFSRKHCNSQNNRAKHRNHLSAVFEDEDSPICFKLEMDLRRPESGNDIVARQTDVATCINLWGGGADVSWTL